MGDFLIPIIPFHKQIITSGEGSYIYDSEGKKYLDLNSGQFCAILGHANPELTECVARLSKSVVHTSSAMLSDLVIQSARELNAISGEMDGRSILLSTGAEAVEFSLRFAKHLTGKEGVVCFEKGYHGLSLGAQSVTFAGKYACPKVDTIFSVPISSATNVDECIEFAEKIIAKNATEIAAVIMEPIVSVGGMLYPPQEYFKAIREFCDKHNVLLIFDESQTCIGRTGSWFYYQELGVVPDLAVCSKGIGLGYPVSAVLIAKKVLSERKLTMTHYSSHQNDPFSAGLVSFAIGYIRKNNLLESNLVKGHYFLTQLKEVEKYNSLFKNPRGYGMMLGLDVFISGLENYRPVYGKIYDKAAEAGLLLQGTDGGRVLRFLPDYLIKKEDIDFAVNILKNISL